MDDYILCDCGHMQLIQTSFTFCIRCNDLLEDSGPLNIDETPNK